MNIEEFIEVNPSCRLCSESSSYLGMYIPDSNTAQKLSPPQKTRIFLYQLCEKCRNEPDAADRVEALLLRDLGIR
jgi:hypothetical protein